MAVVTLEGTRARSLISLRTSVIAAVALACGAVVFLHYWQLSAIPGGVYVDEAEIFWQAQGLALDGHDAHGTLLPLFFQPLDGHPDWKNPLMIYAVAAVFRLFGPSLALQRAVTSTFSLATAALLGLLAWQLVRNRWIGVGTFLVAAVTPSLFALGRWGFELSALPMTLSAFLLVWLLARRRGDWRLALAAGALLGLSLYAYTTARLFVPLLCVALFASELPRPRWCLLTPAGIGAALLAVPMAAFMLTHQGALTLMFDQQSIFTGHPSAAVLLERFLSLYVGTFRPPFLIGQSAYHPDGLILGATLPLVALGLVSAWRRRRDPFVRMAFFGLLLAPVPAALTMYASPERRVLEALPFYAVLAVLAASDLLPLFQRTRMLRAAGVAFLALVALQGGMFVQSYFATEAAYVARLQAPAMPEVVAAIGSYQGPVVVSLAIPGGDEIYAFDESATVAGVRSCGTCGVRSGDVAATWSPGTRLVTTVGERPPHATLLRTFDEPGTAIPELALWRVN